ADVFDRHGVGDDVAFLHLRAGLRVGGLGVDVGAVDVFGRAGLVLTLGGHTAPVGGHDVDEAPVAVRGHGDRVRHRHLVAGPEVTGPGQDRLLVRDLARRRGRVVVPVGVVQ